jgi:hypothetical protein
MAAVTVYLLRIALTPAVVVLAGLIQQRFGHRIGGRVVGLPLKAGPFLVVLLLTEGSQVATTAAQGTVSGLFAGVLFCLTYGLLAPVLRLAWRTLPVALAVSVLGPIAMSQVAQTWVRLLIIALVVVVAFRLWPAPATTLPVRKPARWDLPVRAATAGGLVFVLTTLAPVLGATLAGILAGAPVVLTVVTPATHHNYGPLAAVGLVRGTLRSIPGTATFVTVVSYTLIPLGGVPAFALGLLAMLAVDTVARIPWRRLRYRATSARRRPPAAADRDLPPAITVDHDGVRPTGDLGPRTS